MSRPGRISSSGLIRLGWLGGFALAIPITIGIKSRLFPATLEMQARTVLDCEMEANAPCIQSYLLNDEAKGYSISDGMLSRLLSDYVNPAYSDVSGARSEDMQPLRDQGEFTAIYMWNSANGNEPKRRSVTLAATPEGAKCPGLVREMITEVLFAKYRRKDDDGIYTTLIRGIHNDAARLTSLGVMGFYDDTSKRVLAWDQLAKNWQTKLDRHHADQLAVRP